MKMFLFKIFFGIIHISMAGVFLYSLINMPINMIEIPRFVSIFLGFQFVVKFTFFVYTLLFGAILIIKAWWDMLERGT